ncbi:hypothetical protein PVAND_013122 [Polypedilum vanderplanki]|uniref:Uncharacterized protein n=1 Tax=Polypedilum vanderplanki TaxID=319348 RepID=A0A9J6CPP0_POLVA|nr:hypothetical protein PVAND_013122 [Polypedilum vanderplanki]
MGSEQSHAASNASGSTHSTPRRPVSTSDARLQRGYTIAAPTSTTTTSDNLNNSQLVDTSPPPLDSRPTSPPMSVCSDSDLPYISYTDKPIGDSPKLRNKGQKFNKTRPAVNLRRQSTSAKARPASASGTMIVVNKGTSKDGGGVDRDPDILRLQVNIFIKQIILCV